MPIAVHFYPTKLSQGTFNEILERLTAKGLGAPKGRLLHVSFGSEDDFQVFDIWESEALFEEFGKQLHPILDDLGVQLSKIVKHEVVSMSNSTGAIDMLSAAAV
jgi:hypothetical protein